MEKEYLDHAIIELTSECNLRCEHCYNWWKQEGMRAERFNSYRKAFAVDQDALREVFHDIDMLAGRRELDIVSGVCTPHCLLDPKDYPHVRFGNCSEREIFLDKHLKVQV